MHLEYIAQVVRFEKPSAAPMLATFVVGEQRFAVEVGAARDAAQIERMLRAARADAVAIHCGAAPGVPVVAQPTVAGPA